MKRIQQYSTAIIIGFFITLQSFAQTNTFPSSGNVGIVTTNPTSSLDIYTGKPIVIREENKSYRGTLCIQLENV